MLESLVLPPVGLYVLVAIGLALRATGGSTRRRRVGLGLAPAGAGALVALSIPYVAYALLAGLQTEPAIPP